MLGKPEAIQNAFSPVVIDPVLDDELCFVLRPQAFDIRPVHSIRHAASWTLDVQDYMNRWIDQSGIHCSACFKKDRESFLAQAAE